MNLNLHAEVRGAITSVQSDIPIIYKRSTGATTAAGGKQTPSYATDVTIQGQVQPVSGSDLRKFNFLQGQGIFKSVHCFGDIEGIVRSQGKGGDLLVFPQVPGAASETWLIKAVAETWNTGWCRVIVVLQLDPNNPT